MIFISEENELIWKSDIQVIYFYSSWMPFHQKFLLMLDKMEQKYPDIAFFAIDIDYFFPLCKRFDVITIPTVIFFIASKEIKRINKMISTAEFNSNFESLRSLKHDS